MSRVNDHLWKETNEFIREWGMRCNLSSSEAHLYYELLCSQLSGHLLENKSLDFGIFVVHPCIYRANWKDQVFHAMNWVYPMLFGKPEVERWRLWHEGMGAATFVNHLLLAGQRGLVYTRPELQIRKPWWIRMIRAQKAKRKALGPFKYRAYVLRVIMRLYERMVETWLSWRGELSLPGIRVLESGGVACNQHFAETRISRRLQSTGAQVRFPPVYSPKRPDDIRSEDLEKTVAVSDADLSQVPVLQPSIEDLRDSQLKIGPAKE